MYIYTHVQYITTTADKTTKNLTINNTVSNSKIADTLNVNRNETKSDEQYIHTK